MNSDKKIAVVSGASRGIGLSIAQLLTDKNYVVINADLENEIASLKTSDNLIHFACNIANEENVKSLFSFAKEKLGRIDLLVNNAGIIKDNMIWNMPTEDFDAVINVNLKGTWMMCKYAALIMKEQNSGRIVNIASRAWLGNRGQSNYSASKAGVVALTRVLALELGKYHVSVNAVAPGLIDTPLTQKLKPEVLESLISAQPSKSIGKPEDVANAVVFLGSSETSFITGQVLYVDGGKSVSSNLF